MSVLKDQINALFSGKKINITDQANVMHNYVWGLPKGTNTLTEFDLETRASITSYNINCCNLLLNLL